MAIDFLVEAYSVLNAVAGRTLIENDREFFVELHPMKKFCQAAVGPLFFPKLAVS